MKALLTMIVGLGLMSAFCGCTLTRGSDIVVGTKRPPTDPTKVKLYLHPPAQYEEIAIVSADGRNAFASAQNLMNAAIGRMKKEAAKLGANGVLLTSAGDQYGGSVGSSFGSATATRNGNTATASGYSTSFSSPVVNKAASGLAIYVIRE